MFVPKCAFFFPSAFQPSGPFTELGILWSIGKKKKTGHHFASPLL
jgi:hypothetical protein